MKQNKKKKKKVRYNVIFVPDVATAEVKRFSLSLRVLVTIGSVVAMLIIVALIYCYYLTNHVLVANTSINSLRHEVETLKDEKAQLETENKELQEKVSILSDTVNEKVQMEKQQAEELAKQYIPTGFPLKGTASYSEEVQEIEGNPVAYFSAAAGTSVIATAKGKISAIAGDEENGYIVMVDHENGYFSVYRNSSTPKVELNQEVTTDTEIFNIEAGKELLGYQIIENDTYIDPLSLMEIYG